MAGWGDHQWSLGPWGGEAIFSPVFSSGLIVAWDEPTIQEELPPLLCRRAKKVDLCDLLPTFYCDDDLDPIKGGTGDHHRILGVIEDFLYGSVNQIGVAHLAKSLSCIRDYEDLPDRFLNALLRDLGFNLDIPLTTLQKRRLIPILVANLYKRKGTVPSLEESFKIFLGIPVQVFPFTGEGFGGLVAGEPFDRTLTSISPGDEFVQVSNPGRFEIGKDLIITDVTAPFVDFPAIPILDVVADRVIFADANNPPPTLTGTIEAGAQIYADRFCDQLEADDGTEGGCSKMGADDFDTTEKATYGFYVDIERTVTTNTVLQDGGSQVDLDDVDFIIPGSRLRITDKTAPTESPFIVEVESINGKTVTFDPVSLEEDVEAGAEVINIFTQEEINIINAIVDFAKPNWTFHTLTRDKGDDEAVIG